MNSEQAIPPMTGQATGQIIGQATLPFVGRHNELTMLLQGYAATRNEQMRVFLVAGELGMGKTRLLDAFARYVAHDGITILRGGASVFEGMPPYLPFLEALGQYIREAPLEQLRQQVRFVPHILSNILPELTARLGEIAVSQPFPPEQMRLRLYEAIGTFLEAIAGTSGLVLMLDDLHWADSASLDLLCHIAQHHTQARLLTLGAYQLEEVNRNHALARAISELARQRILTTVTLPPLLPEEIESLAINYLEGPVDAQVGAFLSAQSEGNPFFAEELLQSWLEAKMLVQRHGQWVAAAPLAGALPPSILEAIRQRLVHFSAETINHLRIASVIGRTFDLPLLAQVEHHDLETLEEQILEAVHGRLLQHTEPNLFTFSHATIRVSLYSEVSNSRRQRLHGLIGTLLEERYARSEQMSAYQLAELAFHFARSSDTQAGVTYSQRAGQMAMSNVAPEDAMAHYRTALSLLEPSDSRRVQLLTEFSEAALLAGAEVEALAAGDEALTLLDEVPESEIEIRERVISLNEKLQIVRDQQYRSLIRHLLGELSVLFCDWENMITNLLDKEMSPQQKNLLPGLVRILMGMVESTLLLRETENSGEVKQLLQKAHNLLEGARSNTAGAAIRAWLYTLSGYHSGAYLTSPSSAETSQSGALTSPAESAEQVFPANLTAREVRVLQLVVKGMSNQQVAQQLGLSEKTIANHLTHIFNKTMSENRAAAVAFAIRHGLA